MYVKRELAGHMVGGSGKECAEKSAVMTSCGLVAWRLGWVGPTALWFGDGAYFLHC
jgi:hypothetical protein